jgi:catechol 2,3-dioxygenase-like lactoylglutathione lyase family enzyme
MRRNEDNTMSSIRIRYIADDVDAAIEFYTDNLGFEVVMHPAPGFAALKLGDLQLLLNTPGAGGAGTSMPDGTMPKPRGWNRFVIEVAEFETTVARHKSNGAKFRNEIVEGNGGKQILLEDPSVNPIELLEPKKTR